MERLPTSSYLGREQSVIEETVPVRVLVVDDDELNRELMTELLGCEGLEVHTAADGRSALDMFKTVHPDLVLLDVRMPHIDGLEVCRQLKTDPETRLTPVVMITGLVDSASRLRGIQAGADDFVTKPISRPELMARVRVLLNLKSFTDELERAETVLLTLARSIEAKDHYTQGHCERLARACVALAKTLGLPDDEVTALHRAGIVHDIGKVAVPDAVLLKPGLLTREERQTMEQHPVVGERICAPMKSFRLVLPIIRHHHEKMNGTGYPDGLKGASIPVSARVLQIVDVYDALTTTRSYKRALPPVEAFSIMEQEVRQGWWDGEIFAAFQHMMGSGQLLNSSAMRTAG
jgi:putative two-component system response regulator